MSRSSNSVRSHVRVDGPAKVTGAARFSSDVPLANLAYAVVVTSTIARGRIAGFDLPTPGRIPGLLAVYTYRDFQHAIRPVPHLMAGGYSNSSALPLGSSEIFYAGQIVALVVAESLEGAQQAACRVVVYCDTADSPRPASTFDSPGAEKKALSAIRPSHKDPSLGDAKAAWQSAAVRIEAAYRTPVQHHNPMELFGTTCVWTGPKLTIYEPTRYIEAVQHGVAAQLNIEADNVRVICPFLGGHFGSKLALSQYTAPVAIAAYRLKRPVKFVATRAQCFTVANYRPDTRHAIRIGATRDGEFTCLFHDAEMTTSRFDNFAMEGTDVTASLYKWPNVETSESLVRVDRNTPGPMRAPPEVPYLFALESAIDELAEKLEIDPVELRRRNDTNVDLISQKPFTPRSLMECFDAGAEAFGWSGRAKRPASKRDGDWLVGFGCSSAVRPAKQGAATMRVTLFANGRAKVETAHHEIGNGIYTVLAMEAAARLGLDIDAITVALGDTSLPPAGISGGSSTTGSLVPCLAIGCEILRSRLAAAAIIEGSVFQGRSPQDLQLVDNALRASNGQSMPLSELFARLGQTNIDTIAEFTPEGSGEKAIASLREGKMSLGGTSKSKRWGYGAHFVEVRVHLGTGEIHVPRMTSAFSAGYIENRLTALSQLRGGMIWGLSSALREATEIDQQRARYINDNLAEYLVPVAADTPDLDVLLLNEDAQNGPMHLTGLGELGIIGVNAALANALHNATGKRCRSLPIRLDAML